MLSKIEIRLIDDEGNMSKAFVDYRGYAKMLVEHKIDMINDALVTMVADYNYKKELEIRAKKDPIAEHERFGMPHKH
jgi:hypothetical protein